MSVRLRVAYPQSLHPGLEAIVKASIYRAPCCIRQYFAAVLEALLLQPLTSLNMSHLNSFLDIASAEDPWLRRPVPNKGKHAAHHPPPVAQKQLRYILEDILKAQEEEFAFQQALAIQEQFEKEEEDLIKLQSQILEDERKLEEQLAGLSLGKQETFRCEVCIEDMPVDDVMGVEGCDHELCMDCMRSYVTSKIQDRKYPIPCPLCQVTDGRTEGVIVEEIVRLLGVSEEDFLIFEELQMSQHAVPEDCRKCKRRSWIDKEEHSAAKTITCPAPDCSYQWCKSCRQEIDPDSQVDHTCDGTNELDALIQGLNWRRCPQCTVPVERVSGCNHMICIAPGCNTHFCYKCGNTVYRGTWNNAASEAKYAHLNGPCGYF